MPEKEPIAPEQLEKDNKLNQAKKIAVVTTALGATLLGHPDATKASNIKETANPDKVAHREEFQGKHTGNTSFESYLANQEQKNKNESKFPEKVKVLERFENESDFSVKIEGQWHKYTIADTARPEDSKLASRYIVIRAFPAADKLGLPRDIKFFLWDIGENKVVDIVRQPNKWQYNPQKQKFEWELKNNKLESVKTTLAPGYDVSEPKTIELKPKENYETKEYEYKDKINT